MHSTPPGRDPDDALTLDVLHNATPEQIQLLADRRTVAAAARATHVPKLKLVWPDTQTTVIRALRRNNTEMSYPALAKLYLEEYWVQGTDFRPTYEQVLKKVKNEAMK
ncbi:hypothetical protein HDV00_003127 [Rhizophlyctis rosea]|nr:hypothetical protein HDV00_003127 [Rhizophlyctis rosea]